MKKQQLNVKGFSTYVPGGVNGVAYFITIDEQL